MGFFSYASSTSSATTHPRHHHILIYSSSTSSTTTISSSSIHLQPHHSSIHRHLSSSLFPNLNLFSSLSPIFFFYLVTRSISLDYWFFFNGKHKPCGFWFFFFFSFCNSCSCLILWLKVWFCDCGFPFFLKKIEMLSTEQKPDEELVFPKKVLLLRLFDWRFRFCDCEFFYCVFFYFIWRIAY